MDQQSLINLLKHSLADQKLSREERQKLRDGSAYLRPDEVSALRSEAFKLLQEGIDDERLLAKLRWLEDVIKAVTPSELGAATAHVASAWFSPNQNCPAKIRELIATARRKIDICVFTITDDRLTAAVIDAHRSGVAVRIITDNDKAADLGSDADRLRSAGVGLRIDRTQFHMHHKYAIFDSKILLNGSYNWTRGAAEQNEENFLLLSHPPLIDRYAREFQTLWDSLSDN